jgi:ribosome-binding protein aMBF1 (putative translation factor)
LRWRNGILQKEATAMTDEMKKKIGERIKAARKAKGLSQEVLGEKLEVSFQDSSAIS